MKPALAAALLLAACGAEAIDSGGAAVIDGTPTSARPEIGSIGGCTATLVRSNVAITAAHCMGYASRETAGRYGTFTVNLGPSDARRYNIVRYWSLSGNTGSTDISLLMLETSVPPSVATPTTIAMGEPASGADASIYGYGCTNRSRQSGSGTKRVFTYPFGPSYNLCPGDSGGPLVVGIDGPIFGINSAYYTHNGLDIFGEPWRHRARIDAQIDLWTQRYGGGTEPPPPPADCLGAANAAAAAPLPLPASGAVCANRDSYLGFDLEAGERIELEVRFSHAAGDIDAALFAARGQSVATADGRSDVEQIAWTATERGRVALRVFGYQGASNAVSIDAIIRRPSPPDADRDGVPDDRDRCRATPPGARVWIDGPWAGCAAGQTPS